MTFSSIINPITIQLILTLVVAFNWPIRQLNVSNAFLHGILDEEVYMEQTREFIDKNISNFDCICIDDGLLYTHYPYLYMFFVIPIGQGLQM